MTFSSFHNLIHKFAAVTIYAAAHVGAARSPALGIALLQETLQWVLVGGTRALAACCHGRLEIDRGRRGETLEDKPLVRRPESEYAIGEGHALPRSDTAFFVRQWTIIIGHEWSNFPFRIRSKERRVGQECVGPC